MKENKNWKKQIALFLISQNLSMFGSSVVGFSIVWYITVTTESRILDNAVDVGNADSSGAGFIVGGSICGQI